MGCHQKKKDNNPLTALTQGNTREKVNRENEDGYTLSKSTLTISLKEYLNIKIGIRIYIILILILESNKA